MADGNNQSEITINLDAVPNQEGKHVLTAHIVVKGRDPKKTAEDMTEATKVLVEAGILVDWGGGGP